MEHYVTLFDSKYLPQGIALYRSMEKWCGDFVLWIVCMDELTELVLRDLAFDRLRLLPVQDVETQALLAVKPGRTAREYCWTMTPFTAGAVFSADPTASRVTYLDADLWFRASPKRIFREFEDSEAAVLITEHAYAPDVDQSQTSGIYCVQFVTFVAQRSGPILSQWQAQCLDWCFNRVEDGRFGDQKYLDSWPDDFGAAVHVLSHPEWALGPWNATRFPYGSAVFYHFHGLRITSPNTVEVGPYVLPRPLISAVYEKYLAELRDAVAILGRFGVESSPPWTRQAERLHPLRLRWAYWRRRLSLMRTPTSLDLDSR